MLLLDRMLRRLIKKGRLDVIDAAGRKHEYGVPGEKVVVVRLTDPSLPRKLATTPELACGEAYMDGTLRIEQGSIREFLTMIAENWGILGDTPASKLFRGPLRRLRTLIQKNTPHLAQKNVQHHYDLSNAFYAKWLDPAMQYSCAYFVHDNDTLEQAQQNKLRHIAAKLKLEPGQRVLDIGSGWGGLALYLASVGRVEVLGVTLSSQQLALAREWAERAGLADRVKFQLIDYRHVEGPFDRIVSVGMFEHVGVAHYGDYFGKIRALLKPDGLALVHSIGRSAGPAATDPWLQKYIFPGGYSPAISETMSAIERSGLWVTDMEILRLHYAKTLRHWETRFQARRTEISKMMDERFCRMWEFYLVASELAFTHSDHMNFQIQLAPNAHSLPLTRDYMLDSERKLPAQVPASMV